MKLRLEFHSGQRLWMLSAGEECALLGRESASHGLSVECRCLMSPNGTRDGHVPAVSSTSAMDRRPSVRLCLRALADRHGLFLHGVCGDQPAMCHFDTPL